MKSQEFKQLIQKYQQGELEGPLKDLVDHWYEALSSGKETDHTQQELNRIKSKILAQMSDTGPKTRQIWPTRWLQAGAAAVLLMFAGLGIYWQQRSNERDAIEMTADVEPGGNKAVLILADGRTIDLSEQKDGITIETNGIHYHDGSVLTQQAGPEKTGWNTLLTPKGGQYQITLPDGTKVWLNAQSSLRYPVAFDSDQRIVELEGEAYFEVARIPAGQPTNLRHQPFLVKTKDQFVKVLGTHFNISAYSDEPFTRTTLLEGSVQVRDMKGNQILLEPNQHSLVRMDVGGIQVSDIDANNAIAWKNNMYIFDNTPLDEIMRQINRWYDVVIDIDQIPEDRFYGEISRDVPLSEVLDLIHLTSEYKFKIVAGSQNGKERRVIMQ